MAYDVALGRAILFGGAESDNGCPCYNDTFAFENGTWVRITTPSAPAGRGWAQLAYDPKEASLILFGGIANNRLANDTWRFANGTWRELNNGSSGSPPWTWRGAMTYDPLLNRIVLFGGLGGTPYPRNDTWEYSGGNWTQFIPPNPSLPTGRDGAGLFFDPADRGLVLTGGGYCDAVGCYYFTDTWRFSQGNWTPLRNATLPQDAWSTPVAYDGNLGVGWVVADSGTTWIFRNDSWTNSSLTPFPSGGLFESSSASVPNITPLLVFGGSGSGGVGTNNTTLILGEPTLKLSAFFTGTPRAIDLGQTLDVVVSAEGGNGSLSYAYRGLPPGCSAANVIAFSCTPSTAGLYTMVAWVNDSGGNSTRLARSLVVAPALRVTEAFSAYRLDFGSRVAIWANVSGGTAVGNVTWSGLSPSNCQNRSGSDPIQCSPAIGTWPVQASVCDSLHECANSSDLMLFVSPALGLHLWGWTLQGPPEFTEAFVANLSGGSYPIALSWVFSDGVTSAGTEQHAVHTFPGPGNWSAALTARDASNSTRYEEFYFGLTRSPTSHSLTASISASTEVVDSGGQVTWTASALGGLGPVGYRWGGLPPDCPAVSGQILTCRSMDPGIYAPYVEVNDSHGDSAWAGSALTIFPGLNVSLSPPVLFRTCAPDSVAAAFTATPRGGDPGYSLRWSFGDGSSAMGSASFNHTYAPSTGTYLATVTVTDQLGVTASNSTRVGASPATTCPPSPTGDLPKILPPGYSLGQVLLVSGAALAGGFVVGVLVVRVTRTTRR